MKRLQMFLENLRQTSLIFGNGRMAFERHSSSESFGLEISQNATSCSREEKLLEREEVARNMKCCQKVAEQLVESPRSRENDRLS